MESGGASQQLRDLQSVTDAALSALPLEDLLDELLTRVRAILSADTVAILLLDEDERWLAARAAKGLEEEVERGVRIPVGKGFAGRIAAERRPIHIADVSKADIYNPILREKGLKSLLGVPLMASGELLGILHVGTLHDRQFDDEDTQLLERVADRAALAIQAGMAQQERALAHELQRALFPRPLPSFPGVALAARYSPAASAALGGDWYDAFLTPGGSLGIAIGDVVGRGFRAAALMGQLRSALRAYALDERPPEELLARLNRLLRQIDPGRSATVVYLVFDPRSGDIVVANAGNPPPLVLTPAGESSLLQTPPAVPLGATAFPEYEVVRSSIPPGSRLLLYTDGLVERSDQPLGQGMEQLRSAAPADEPDLERFCDGLMRKLLPDGPRADDVALIALHADALPNPLVLDLKAERESAPLFRRILARWLHAIGADEDQVDALVLACSEASSNAIEHAYSPEVSQFRLEAACHAGTVTLTIRDWGRWRAARGENRGRGMMIMEALTDSVEVERGEDGTAVTLRFDLERAAA